MDVSTKTSERLFLSSFQPSVTVNPSCNCDHNRPLTLTKWFNPNHNVFLILTESLFSHDLSLNLTKWFCAET